MVNFFLFFFLSGKNTKYHWGWFCWSCVFSQVLCLLKCTIFIKYQRGFLAVGWSERCLWETDVIPSKREAHTLQPTGSLPTQHVLWFSNLFSQLHSLPRHLHMTCQVSCTCFLDSIGLAQCQVCKCLYYSSSACLVSTAWLHLCLCEVC